MALTLLHTNDFHGALDQQVADRLRDFKSDGLYLDSGDVIKAGNLGVPIRAEPAWGFLASAGCDASVLGNRETHVLESAFQAKIRGCRHPLLCANLRHKDGSRPLAGHLLLERGGMRVGIIAAMVPMVTEKMASRAASAYLWDPPLGVLKPMATEIRPHVELLIALTHIGFRQDQDLARLCPELDVILGGHSHTVLETPVQVGRTWICQGGSHGRYAGLYAWSDGELSGGLVPLKPV
ncbi:MAG TPA: hypothetical protein VM328_10565 [Fimbriimonadaceae bacterium]|nr:hypothetical protein [Fimbriimonadaceae bacterium]